VYFSTDKKKEKKTSDSLDFEKKAGSRVNHMLIKKIENHSCYE